MTRKEQIAAALASMPIHPLADRFPLMQGAEFDELVGDLQRRPLNRPITIHKGMIVDGRNRARACQKAKREPTYVELSVILGKPDEDITEQDIRRYIIQENLLRRDLTPEQRRSRMKELLGLNPLQSDRMFAAQAGIDHKTAAKLRAEMESTGEISPVAKRTGKDGKARARPVRKQKPRLKPMAQPEPRPTTAAEKVEAALEVIADSDLADIAEELAQRFSVTQIGEICALATRRRNEMAEPQVPTNGWTDCPAAVEAAAA
jgi:hypothetical protein